MDKKNGAGLIIAVVFIIIAIAFVAMRLQAPTEGPALMISNFEFSEVQNGSATFLVSGTGSTATFEGPIQKPTPCHTLSATYGTVDNDVVVDITAASDPGTICIQVIAETFYRGSFEFSRTMDEVIVNYRGQELGRQNFA